MVEKIVHYPTRNELCRVAKETIVRSDFEITKMSFSREVKQVLEDKIFVTKKASPEDQIITDYLERKRKWEEKYVDVRKRKGFEKQ